MFIDLYNYMILTFSSYITSIVLLPNTHKKYSVCHAIYVFVVYYGYMWQCNAVIASLFSTAAKKHTLCTNSSLFIPFICILQETAYTLRFGSPIYFIIVLMHEFRISSLLLSEERYIPNIGISNLYRNIYRKQYRKLRSMLFNPGVLYVVGMYLNQLTIYFL